MVQDARAIASNIHNVELRRPRILVGLPVHHGSAAIRRQLRLKLNHPLLIPTNLPLQPLATFLGLYPSGVKLSRVLHDLGACSWSAGRA